MQTTISSTKPRKSVVGRDINFETIGAGLQLDKEGSGRAFKNNNNGSSNTHEGEGR